MCIAVNYKDYRISFKWMPDYALFEVDVEKQRYLFALKMQKPYIRYPERRFCLIWKSFHPTPGRIYESCIRLFCPSG